MLSRDCGGKDLYSDSDTTDLLLVFLVPFVAFWTARLALARGRSPWIWGGAALVLGIPWPGVNLPILGVVPVLFLMFFVRSTEQQGNERRNTCSKCASSHTPGQNYCTKCGWDLSREFSTETTDTVLASEMHQPQGASTATLERPAETSIPEAASGPGLGQDPTAMLLEEDATASEPVPERVYEEAAAVAYQDADSEGAPAVSDAEPEAEPETRPWGMPVPGPAPTADGMTARGAASV